MLLPEQEPFLHCVVTRPKIKYVTGKVCSSVFTLKLFMYRRHRFHHHTSWEA